MLRCVGYRKIALLGLFPTLSYTLPVAEKVSEGKAEFYKENEKSLTIKTSDRSIIRYKNFSIQSDETVRFVQPSKHSIALNRVTGEDPSAVFGSLTSNGKIFLINPNGIYFGPSAQVNVGSIVASTLEMSEQDFIEGKWYFRQKGHPRTLVQEGVIKAEGDIVLLSSSIENRGEILATVGKVAMGSGDKVTLHFSEDKMIGFSMDGNLSGAQILQEGHCEAQNGEVVLSVNTARKLLDAMINTDTVAEGDSFEEENGKIFLRGSSVLSGRSVSVSGGDRTSIYVEGMIRAASDPDTGGSVTVLGGDVQFGKSVIDVSGKVVGGEISVSSIPGTPIRDIFLSEGTVLSASGGVEGGRISLHATEYLGLKGVLSAPSGTVETISTGILRIGTVTVDVGSATGTIGTWFSNPSSPESLALASCSGHLHLALRGEASVIAPLVLTLTGRDCILQADDPEAVLSLGSDIRTAGGRVIIKSPSRMAGDNPVRIETSGGDIVFLGALDGSGSNADLILDPSDTGSVVLQEGAGKTVPLGALRIDAGKSVFLGSDLILAGKDLTLSAPLILGSDLVIDTTGGGNHPSGGDILLHKGMSGNYRCKLDAGSAGSVAIRSGIGTAGEPLASVFVKGSKIRLSGDVKADGGTIIYQGPVILESDSTMVDTGPTGIIFLDTLDAGGSPVSLTLSAPLGRIAFLGAVGNSSSLGDLSASSYRIEIGSDIDITGNLLLSGPVTLSGNAALTAAGITTTQTVDGPYNLTLNAGTGGSITLGNHVGKQRRIKTFVIEEAGSVQTLGIYAEAISQLAGGGTSIFSGVLDTVYPEGISLTGNNFTIAGGITTENGGGLTVAQTGTLDIRSPVSLSGAFTQTTSGNVNLGSRLVTQGQDIVFSGPLLLTAASVVSTGDEGAGDIVFSDVESTFGSPYSLDLLLGSGNLTFSDTVGSVNALGVITIYSVKNVTAAGSIRSAGFTQLQGLGAGSYTGNITSNGSDSGIYIFSNYLTFAGATGGQFLRTLGNGNIMINSVYRDLGSADNPLQIGVAGGLGTFFEGSSGDVYITDAGGGAEKICSVRSNPGCTVWYSKNGGAYQDVTPDICCSHIGPTPPPPPPPPGPPSPSGKRHHHREKLIYYIPGIYTNYWAFKDTLGAPWYFTKGIDTRWWDSGFAFYKPIERDESLFFFAYGSDQEIGHGSLASQTLFADRFLAEASSSISVSTGFWTPLIVQQKPAYGVPIWLMLLGTLSVPGIIAVSASDEIGRTLGKRPFALWRAGYEHLSVIADALAVQIDRFRIGIEPVLLRKALPIRRRGRRIWLRLSDLGSEEKQRWIRKLRPYRTIAQERYSETVTRLRNAISYVDRVFASYEKEMRKRENRIDISEQITDIGKTAYLTVCQETNRVFASYEKEMRARELKLGKWEATVYQLGTAGIARIGNEARNYRKAYTALTDQVLEKYENRVLPWEKEMNRLENQVTEYCERQIEIMKEVCSPALRFLARAYTVTIDPVLLLGKQAYGRCIPFSQAVKETADTMMKFRRRPKKKKRR